MTTQDLKTEINKALEKVPEEKLNEVLAYLQEMQQSASFSNPEHLKKILEEDREVLKKLAQ